MAKLLFSASEMVSTIIREQAHQISLALAVKKAQGEGLKMGEEIPADVAEDLGGCPDHDLGVAQRGKGPCRIDGSGNGHPHGQTGETALLHDLVDNGLDHIGAQEAGGGADRGQDTHQDEQHPVPAQIGEEGAQGLAQILGALSVKGLGDPLSHLLSSGKRRSPGRWNRFSKSRLWVPTAWILPSSRRMI